MLNTSFTIWPTYSTQGCVHECLQHHYLYTTPKLGTILMTFYRKTGEHKMVYLYNEILIHIKGTNCRYMLLLDELQTFFVMRKSQKQNYILCNFSFLKFFGKIKLSRNKQINSCLRLETEIVCKWPRGKFSKWYKYYKLVVGDNHITVQSY